MSHTATTYEGYSGTPLLVRKGTSWQICGIHLSEPFYRVGKLVEENYAASAPAIELLVSLIDGTALGGIVPGYVDEVRDEDSLYPR